MISASTIEARLLEVLMVYGGARRSVIKEEMLWKRQELVERMPGGGRDFECEVRANDPEAIDREVF